MAFRGRGPPRQQTGSPHEDAEGQEGEALSLHYEAPSQQAGCLLILIGTTDNLVTPSTLPW